MVAKNKIKPLAAAKAAAAPSTPVAEHGVQSGGITRRLASVEKKVRDRAVDLLASWLECRQSVEDGELRKIWKGLFYCYWHSDKAIVQADLAERLASLVQRLPSDLGLQFFEGYLGTMRREWGGIDHLRMDKFYLLQRKFLRSMFMALRQQGWEKSIVRRYMDAVKDRSLLADDLFPAQGCSMHLADVFLDELGGVLPEEKEVFGMMLEPFYVVLARCSDKTVVKRVKVGVFDRLLKADRDETEKKMVGFVMDLPVENRLFEFAAMADTIQCNRKVLYALSDDFKKLKKGFKAIDEAAATIETKKSTEATPSSEDPIEKPAKIAEATASSTKKKKKKSSSSPAAGVLVKSPESTVKQDDPVVSNLAKRFDVAGKGVDPSPPPPPLPPPLEMVSSPLITKKSKKNRKNDAAVLPDANSIAAAAALASDSNGGGIKLEEIKRKQSPVSPINTASKKRKSSKDESPAADDESGGGGGGESSSGKKVKKVRFSLKSNTTWKISSGKPLKLTPLRLDLTPKSGVLKKGLSPGPINKMSPSPKRKKTPSPLSKPRNRALPKKQSPWKKGMRW